MHHVEPKIEFKVYYRPNPEYEGEYNVPSKSGLHGTFDNIRAARAAVEKCRAWFGEEKIVTLGREINGKREEIVRTVKHDNVIVWIEKYKDGFQDGEIQCEESSEASDGSTEKPASGKKSKRTSSTTEEFAASSK